jgi:hypothetical protein
MSPARPVLGEGIDVLVEALETVRQVMAGVELVA